MGCLLLSPPSSNGMRACARIRPPPLCECASLLLASRVADLLVGRHLSHSAPSPRRSDSALQSPPSLTSKTSRSSRRPSAVWPCSMWTASRHTRASCRYRWTRRRRRRRGRWSGERRRLQRARRQGGSSSSSSSRPRQRSPPLPLPLPLDPPVWEPQPEVPMPLHADSPPLFQMPPPLCGLLLLLLHLPRTPE